MSQSMVTRSSADTTMASSACMGVGATCEFSTLKTSLEATAVLQAGQSGGRCEQTRTHLSGTMSSVTFELEGMGALGAGLLEVSYCWKKVVSTDLRRRRLAALLSGVEPSSASRLRLS